MATPPEAEHPDTDLAYVDVHPSPPGLPALVDLHEMCKSTASSRFTRAGAAQFAARLAMRGRAAGLPERVLVHPVGEVDEREAGRGVGPGDLATGAVVPERRCADTVLPIPRRFERPSSPARTRPSVRFAGVPRKSGNVLRTCVVDVGEHVGVPDAGRVVQQRLVEEREVGGGRDATAARHADRSHGRVVEAASSASGVTSVHGSSGMPITAISSSRRRGLAGVDELVDVALLGLGHADLQAASARADRGSRVRTYSRKSATGRAFDQLREHPVRGSRVVLERGARLPVASPRREPREPRVAVVPFAAERTARAGSPTCAASPARR